MAFIIAVKKNSREKTMYYLAKTEVSWFILDVS